MNSSKTLLVTLTILATLILASLACNMPAISPGNVRQPDSPQESPSEPVEPLAPGTGQATSVSLTESQINAMIAQLLVQDNTFQNVQVRLEAGNIILTGQVNQGNLTLPLSANLGVSADGQGGIDIAINSATVGPLPIPQGMRTQFESQINQGLDPLMSEISQGMRIESVVIGDGVLTVTGTLP